MVTETFTNKNEIKNPSLHYNCPNYSTNYLDRAVTKTKIFFLKFINASKKYFPRLGLGRPNFQSNIFSLLQIAILVCYN